MPRKALRTGRSVRDPRPRVCCSKWLRPKPACPDPHDVTVVTIAKRRDGTGEKNRTFSFSVEDLRNGPIDVPDLQARVVGLSDLEQCFAPNRRSLVRKRIALEPSRPSNAHPARFHRSTPGKRRPADLSTCRSLRIPTGRNSPSNMAGMCRQRKNQSEGSRIREAAVGG